MSNLPTTNQDFHWQGRHDAEDGAMGKRVPVSYTHLTLPTTPVV